MIHSLLFKAVSTAVLCIVLHSGIVRAEADKCIVVDSAAVVCAEINAAEAGLKILEAGGNAIDAVTTVAFAMAVTYPRAGNIGGGGFLLYRSMKGEVTALDFRETAPFAAAFDMYLDENQDPIDEKSQIGALAVGVPGTVRGLFTAHQRFGNLSWRQVLQPAIQLARDGFVVEEHLAQSLNEKQENLGRFRETREIFFPEGNLPAQGDLFLQPDLAMTLERISRFGDSVFYEGDIADNIIATVQKYGGLLSKEDFVSYRAVYRDPIVIEYRGYRIHSMPPPSSGGLVLQGILNTVQQVNLSEEFEHNSADYVAFLSEIEKHWYAYRNLHLGDPDFIEISFALFSSPQKAKEVLSMVSASQPLASEQMPQYQQILDSEGQETTHISVLDAQGNAVSMTYTLNGSYGSFLAAEETGILLNNEMDDFTVKPGHPNLYGLAQGWQNAIEPGKRMLSSLTPTIVVREGQLSGILGSPGGSKIITSVLQILLNKIDYRMSLEEAMSMGRFHHQWLPDMIYYEENRIPETVIADLNTRGFRTRTIDKIGDIQAIWRANASGWEACSDQNGNGAPVGY